MHYYSDFTPLFQQNLICEPQTTAYIVFLSINSYLHGKVFDSHHCTLNEFFSYKGRKRHLKYDSCNLALKRLFTDHFVELITRDYFWESALVRGIFSFGLASAAIGEGRHSCLVFPRLFWFFGCFFHLVLRVAHELYLYNLTRESIAMYIAARQTKSTEISILPFYQDNGQYVKSLSIRDLIVYFIRCWRIHIIKIQHRVWNHLSLFL